MTEPHRSWPQDHPAPTPKPERPAPNIPTLVAMFLFVASPMAGFIIAAYTNAAHGVAVWLGGWILTLAAACVAMYRKA